MKEIINIRDKFNIYKNNPNLVYFDSAASALKLNDAVVAMNKYYNESGVNVHRGAYNLSYETTLKYESSREYTAKFLKAKEDEIIFTRGTTSSLNTVANSFSNKLTEKDEIIVSELEHHSSIIPWVMVAKKTGAKIKYVPLTKEGRITTENFKKVITKNTKIVALTLASNVLGYITPMEDIIKITRETSPNAYVVVDAAQAAPHMRIDVKKMDCDFLAFSGHKLYGPTGIGVLYVKKELMDELDPFEFGGEMVMNFSKEELTWKEGPYKFEAGTPIIAGAIGLKEALKFIDELGYEKIENHIKVLHEYIVDELEKIDGVKIYNKNADIGIITFNIDDVHPHDIASYLDQYNIAIRAGHHCAQLVSEFLNVNSTLRVSVNIYNDKKDSDVLIKAIKEARDFFRQF